MKSAKIYHLYHSGVVVETDKNFYIFDYYFDVPENCKRKLKNGVIEPRELKKTNKGIYVFVSHAHGDHFNSIIFTWKKEIDNIKYILSDNIKCGRDDNYWFVSPYDEIKIDNVTINTFGSTDQGVSFLVKTPTHSIFHSGDLNWWHWKSLSENELKKEEKDYKDEIKKIKKHDINIAFVPVDPRLEEYYYLAGEYFIEQISPDYFVPIHFSGNYKITEKFAKKISQSNTTTIINFKKRKNAHFNIDK